MVSQSKIVQVVRQALLNAADELLSHQQETSTSFDHRAKNGNARKRSSSSSSMKKTKKKTIRKKKTSC